MSAQSTKAAIAVALPFNPVWRSYAGGKVLRSFRRQPAGEDNHFPEDWLASTVLANNGRHSERPDEGLSYIADAAGKQRLLDLLKAEPDYWFGSNQIKREKNPLGVLWKLLDSSVRLQIQAHPNANFARLHLNSHAGKTECWYILGTRGSAHVYLGFQKPPAREQWASMIREQRVEEMLACFEKIRVQPGDCYVVPAGTPHAIGPGVFMVELMEPTDWVVRCETVTAGLALPPEACFMGLDLERCLDIFDYHAYPVVEVRNTFRQKARLLRKDDSFSEEELIAGRWREFFRLHRLRGTGDASWPGKELMLAIVLKGNGSLGAGAEFRELGTGQTWLLPGAAEQWDWRNSTGEWEILLAKLPLQRNGAMPGYE